EMRALGDSCEGRGVSCQYDLFCAQNQTSQGGRTCMQFFGIQQNQPCGFNSAAIGANGTYASLECEFGLACIEGQCLRPDLDVAGEPCTNDPDCGGIDSGYRCLANTNPCSPPGNFCTPIFTLADVEAGLRYEEYAECVQSSGCSTQFDTYPPFK